MIAVLTTTNLFRYSITLSILLIMLFFLEDKSITLDKKDIGDTYKKKTLMSDVRIGISKNNILRLQRSNEDNRQL